MPLAALVNGVFLHCLDFGIQGDPLPAGEGAHASACYTLTR